MTHCCCHPCWTAPSTTSLCSHPLLGIHRHSESVDGCQWLQFFPHGGTQWHTFASYTLVCQTPFCQTAPLLPPVTQQQNITAYWWKGSTISPMSTSNTLGLHNKIGGIAFGATLILQCCARCQAELEFLLSWMSYNPVLLFLHSKQTEQLDKG